MKTLTLDLGEALSKKLGKTKLATRKQCVDFLKNIMNEIINEK